MKKETIEKIATLLIVLIFLALMAAYPKNEECVKQEYPKYYDLVYGENQTAATDN